MLELGKPIHTFDAAAVHAGPDGRPTIIVRARAEGEVLETLDHVVRELIADTLLIADPSGRSASRASWAARPPRSADATTDVAIESAIFDPVSIRRTAQRLALRSEASSRFEKGQETRLARLGADRTAQLVREWAGGEIARGASTPRPTSPSRTARRLPPRPRQPAPRHGPLRRRAARAARPGRHRDRARRRHRARRRRAGARSVVVVDGEAARRSSRSSRPGAATSPSRPTSPRRSPASAATSSCPRSRRTPRCPPSARRRSRPGSWSARRSPAPASRRS